MPPPLSPQSRRARFSRCQSGRWRIEQASLQIGPERLESGRVSLEIGQGRSFEDVNALDRIFQRRSQFPWRITSNYYGQTSVRSRYDPTLQFPEPIFLDA